jgi:hypothetical protein
MDNMESSAPAESSEALEVSPESSEQQLEEVPAEESAEVAKEEVKAEKKRIKQLKLKFNGKDILEDLPFEIDDDPKAIEYMTKQLQKAKLSESKSQEFSQLEKDVSNFLKELKSNPRKALTNPAIGLDIKQFAAEKSKNEKDMKEREYNKLVEQEYERFDKQISDAINKSELPKSPYVLNKITDYMIMALQNGKEIPVESVVELARNEIMQDVQSMVEAMPVEALEAFLGKNAISKLRKQRVAAAKVAPPQPLKSAIQDVGGKSESKPAGEKVSFNDFFGRL